MRVLRLPYLRDRPRAACLLAASMAAGSGGCDAAEAPAAAGLPPLDVAALVAACERCHGPGGVSAREDVPSLAGTAEEAIVAALDAFYFYERHCPAVAAQPAEGALAENDMCGIASWLSEEEIRAVARHFASRPGPAD